MPLAFAQARTGWEIARSLLPILFGGIFVVSSVAALRTNHMTLLLDVEGLEITFWFRRYRSPWNKTDHFVPFRALPMVLQPGSVSFRDESRPVGVWGSGLSLNMRILDKCGFRAEDLAALLTAWRTRALAAHGDSGPAKLTPTQAISP
jgi:hypothetical protein